jgi:hypothetical protein
MSIETSNQGNIRSFPRRARIARICRRYHRAKIITQPEPRFHLGLILADVGALFIDHSVLPMPRLDVIHLLFSLLHTSYFQVQRILDILMSSFYWTKITRKARRSRRSLLLQTLFLDRRQQWPRIRSDVNGLEQTFAN